MAVKFELAWVSREALVKDYETNQRQSHVVTRMGILFITAISKVKLGNTSLKDAVTSTGACIKETPL